VAILGFGPPDDDDRNGELPPLTPEALAVLRRALLEGRLTPNGSVLPSTDRDSSAASDEPAANIPTPVRSAANAARTADDDFGRPATPWSRATDFVREFPTEWNRARQEHWDAGAGLLADAWQDLSHGSYLPMTPGLDPHRWSAGGYLKGMLGAAGAVLSPATALITAGVERPFTRLTGNPVAGQKAGLLVPLLGPAKLAGRAAELAERGGARTLRASAPTAALPPAPKRIVHGSLSGKPTTVAGPIRPSGNQYDAAATFEQVSGEGIGHLPGFPQLPYDVRLAYSIDPKVPWVSESGSDVIYDALKIRTKPTVQTTGAYKSERGQVEVNPAFVARPGAELIGPADNLELSASAKANLDTAEGFRAFFDGQNAGGYHIPVAGQLPELRTSVRIPLARPVSQEQMVALTDVAIPAGYHVADTRDGITLIGTEAGPTAEELGRMLQAEWGQKIADILKVRTSDLQQYKVLPGYIDYEDLFALANAGSGKATRKLLERMSPEARAALDASPSVRQEIAERIVRDDKWAAATNAPVRPDLQLARRIYVERGFPGLIDALNKGLPLPVVLAALGLGSGDDAPPERAAL
jgi:hypothetical protein